MLLSIIMFLIPTLLLVLTIIFAFKYIFADANIEQKNLYYKCIKTCLIILLIYIIVVIAIFLIFGFLISNDIWDIVFEGLGVMMLIVMLFLIFVLPIIVLILLIASIVFYFTTPKTDLEKKKKIKKEMLICFISLIISIAISFGVACYLSNAIMSSM